MPDRILKQGRILIVDDEQANVRFLEIVLEQAGYTNFFSTRDPCQTLSLFAAIQPDLLLLDLHMPRLDGFAVMEKLQADPIFRQVPILVLTADGMIPVRHKALAMGAKDFLLKPLDETEALLRIKNLLEMRLYNARLESKVQQRTAELERAQLETVERLARAAEHRDDATGLHIQRVGSIAGQIALALNLPCSQADLIELAAPLHDVGKIGVSDTILLKPGKLTEEEFAVMKQHTHIGAKILSGSTCPLLKMAEEIALFHHERWDGRGYGGLRGEAIPLSGRIVSVADVFDALTHDRPYKKAWSVEAAVAEIACQSGCQFDANVVEAFLTLPHQDLV